ncbi:type II secretion system F family protein [Aurantimonas sp. HBX-1]|uniref:type II secretion system F family protein n=1 Tax=Aurantimonas sp. HBX-1 TaxID=2906072 RepID=UPI001F43D29F|nr:type II secretion system F family protein [Aurantimonas sp. HBX-1]UIJ70488.1 type II secretion system F family protein [Aurantimonas sp. HBX-1]
MNLASLTGNPELLPGLMAALAAFAAILVVGWPYLARDHLGQRMQKIASEREFVRVRERERLNAVKKPASLRQEPKKIFTEIVGRFRLARQSGGGELVPMLRMAGYRGQGPVTTYLAARVIAPAVMFAGTLFYVFVVLQLEHPPIAKLGMAVAAAGLGYYAPALYVKNKISKRQKAIRRAWPDALDLLLICVESGMAIESAFRKVSEEIGSQSNELAEELSLTTAELAYLQDRRQAYENLGRRTALEAVRGVVTSLIQAEKYGTPLGQSLRVMAQESRDMRMSEAEKKAAALPPKLTVPMILFFLPVLFAIIITPAAIQMSGIN